MSRLLLAIPAVFLCVAMSSGGDAPKVPKDSCVKACMDCANQCAACMKHCKENKMEDSAVQSEICHHACLLCALAVQSKNGQSWASCELCEKVCNDCAAMCEKSPHEIMKKTAEACRACAKACAEARK